MGKRVINTMEKCPSNTDFSKYINGSAEDSFIVLFEEHIKQCALCKEAIEGYKEACLLYDTSKLTFNQPTIKTDIRKLSVSKWTAYAAAIAVLFSITFLFINRNHKFNNHYAHADVQMNNNKKLMHKTTTNYWYVGKNETIAVNDKLISQDELPNAYAIADDKVQVIIQIEDEQGARADKIISSIKLNQKVPVYTISKQRGLKVE